MARDSILRDLGRTGRRIVKTDKMMKNPFACCGGDGRQLKRDPKDRKRIVCTRCGRLVMEEIAVDSHGRPTASRRRKSR